MRSWHALAAALALLPLAACVGPAPQPEPGRPTTAGSSGGGTRGHTRPRVVIAEPDVKDSAPVRGEIPADVASTPDAVPKWEPRSRSGNPVEYEAFGEVYRILDNTEGFTQRGRASWYGKKFHGRKTASGEPYDMFAMTAAHKTLPIPSYVRVTNLDNGRSAVVRINDRGPFHSERIIDLSYAAAARLGIIQDGHAEVQIAALQPGDDSRAVASAERLPDPVAAAPSRPPPAKIVRTDSSPGGRWLQVAAYADPINAVAMRDTLSARGLSGVAVRDGQGGKLHRVVIGPYASEADAQDVRDWLHGAGYAAFWLKE
ncbi:septal ring lytic transglycosylase RlpA family protein [Solimonas flava]|uniref:septal ring lytic transglycosylase RlpA family protein n=1 Tax=Solimonas flava TaxID=415849 RepID=UPI0004269163|nr:septal ring lytic transglycosylase RlpA family protein [Solimonas flava]